MLINILAKDNFNSYNVVIANMFGLDIAVYLEELININNKAIRKDKFFDCFFSIDREYIKYRTTFDVDKQYELDNKLLEIGILSKDKKDKDKISLDLILLINLMSSEDEDLKSGVQKLVELKSKKPKSTKKEKITEELKKFVNSGNKLLDDFIKDWIDSVIAKQGWMTKAIVLDGQQKVINFSFPDVNKAIEILKIASLNGYRDIDWAINVYNDKHKSNKNFNIADKNITINSDIKF